jgi:F-type H+-transporting ATPase subunit delta
MTSDLSIAKKYASALFEAALQNSAQDAVYNDFANVYNSLSQTPELKSQLLNKSYPKALKSSIWNLFLSKTKVAKEFTNFIDTLVSNNKAFLFDQIYKRFHEVYLNHKGYEIAYLETAIPLTESEIKVIKDEAEDYFKTKLEIEVKQDLRLIAGFIIRVKSQMLDYSVANALNTLKKKMQATKIKN